MVISQRNGTSSVTADGTVGYTLDRWLAAYSQLSKFTIQQNAGSVTPPAGFTNYLGITSSSAYSVSSSDYFVLQQRIEGFNVSDFNLGTASAASFTLSFWVRSSLTGTFGGTFGADGTRSYPFTYTISSANTWEQKSITVAGDTSGTWNKTNSIGLTLSLSLGTGTTFSGTAGAWASSNFLSATGATSVVGTNGATFYITGVQLEKGTQATSFEYRQYQQELALCQRYFQKYTGALLSGYNATSGTIFTTLLFPVELRANPTINYSNFINSNCSNAVTNAVTTKLLRVSGVITSTASGFSIFDAETSGAEL
jgi:hypothetical protein